MTHGLRIDVSSLFTKLIKSTMAKCMRLTRLSLLIAALGASSGFTSVSQAQALTPDQLTLQVKRLEIYTEKSVIMLNRVDKELTLVKQQLNKVERIIDNRTMIEMLQRVDELSNEIFRCCSCVLSLSPPPSAFSSSSSPCNNNELFFFVIFKGRIIPNKRMSAVLLR